MAGNRQVFEQAMRQGTNYAWDRQWDKAIAEYQRAIAECPNEAAAYAALGQALVYQGRAEEALHVFQRAARLTPEDPAAVARVAELQEQTGNVAGSVQTWLHAAEMHLRRRGVDAALEVWQHVVELAPDNVVAHEKLAKAYAGMDFARKALRQHLRLAAVYQKTGDQEKARGACQRALELDPRDPDVLTALEALQQGRSLADLAAERSVEIAYAGLEPASGEEVGPKSPAEKTRQKALKELADALLEDNGFGNMEATAALLQAVDFQTRGEVEGAIDSYAKAIALGVQNQAAHFNLGLLYQEKLQFEDAVEQLERTVDDPDYSPGAHFALGECWRALGHLDKAAEHFVNALGQLDMATVGPESAEALQQNYAVITRHYTDHQRNRLVGAFINALVEFLTGEKWENRLRQTRQQLNRLDSERIISLAEIVTLTKSDQVLTAMVKSKEYLEQGMLRSASEECLWAIEQVPDYLPLHLHLARLFRQGNQLGIAVSKYLFVADTYAVRGEMDEARGLYEQVLRVAPMDLDVRRKLIALLKDHGMVEKALEHQFALADAYYELAQIESSREQYRQALKLASRLADSKAWTARILHRLGDIDLQRLDWRGAVEVFIQLKKVVPEDAKARQRLVELYLNLQRRPQAIAELDEMIKFCRQEGTAQAARAIVEELVASRPEELELRKRAAQLSVETGDKQGAISHLDAIGELQLQAGRVDAAAATIKAIIALRPENLEAYRRLLEQIM